MSDIQDEAYSEAMDEIRSLEAFNEALNQDVTNLINKVQGLKSLLIRAADALEEYLPLVNETWNAKASAKSKLIDELRKAAE